MQNAKTSLSNADSYRAIGEFWDAHELTEFWDETRPADFEVAPDGDNYYFSVETELAQRLRAAAQRHGVSPQALINGWLQERLAQEIGA